MLLAGVIFDIDGTLVDSVDLHAKAWQEAFRHFGHDLPYDRVRSQIGKGSDQLIPALLPAAAVEAKGEEIDAFRGDLFRRDYLPRVKAFPAVRELFERIRADGRQIALASSAKPEDLDVYLQVTRIGDLIASTTTSGDADRSKPHPDIFEIALDRLGPMKAADAVVIGDTPYDAEAAGKIGLRTIGVLCGGWSADELQRAGCITTYRDPADLLARYNNSPLAKAKA